MMVNMMKKRQKSVSDELNEKLIMTRGGQTQQ